MPLHNELLDWEPETAVTKPSKGELLVQHAVFRQPVNVVFLKPAYRQG